MKLIVGAFMSLTLLFSPAVDGGLPVCGRWYTISTSAKTYSPCTSTTIGPWTSPVGGCLQWVSWKRTQSSTPYNRAGYQNRRVLLENEVRARWNVTLGPVSVTKTQTIWGSHTTKTISTYRVSAPGSVCV